MTRFLDAYAIMEILDANPDFTPFLDDSVTSVHHLYEIHIGVARLRDEETADEAYDAFRPRAVHPSDEDIRLASRLKRERRSWSQADALGYAMARNRDLVFVTGDKGFEGVEHVEFVKGKRRR